MDKIFALYDSDIFYATRFMEYFKGRQEYGFRLSVFTRKDRLEEFLLANPVEILLAGELIRTEELNLDHVRYIYRLTENRCKELNADIPEIYKYQSVNAVMKNIIDDYKDRENILGGKAAIEEKTNILSVFSPVPGLEGISFAWALSLLLAEQHNVLLVLLELLPVRLIESAEDSSNALTEFIYYLKGASNITDKIKLLQKRQGSLSYLSGIAHASDIISLTKEDMLKWAENLRKCNTYRTVIFYISCHTEAMTELMNNSDSVLIAVKDTIYEGTALQVWEKQMNTSGINIRKDKFHMLRFRGSEAPDHMPVTSDELVKSPSWEDAWQYLNS